MQIATDCNLTYNAVRQVILKEEIVPAKQVNTLNFYDKWQQDYIHSVLYFSGVLEEITLESKINNEPEETCLICEHRQSHQCGSKTFQYCGLRKSNKTKNRLLKIKCKDAACALFKEININSK